MADTINYKGATIPKGFVDFDERDFKSWDDLIYANRCLHFIYNGTEYWYDNINEKEYPNGIFDGPKVIYKLKPETALETIVMDNKTLRQVLDESYVVGY